MNIKDQIKTTEKLLEGVRELNGEFQDGWEQIISEGEQMIKYLKEKQSESEIIIKYLKEQMKNQNIVNSPSKNNPEVVNIDINLGDIHL